VKRVLTVVAVFLAATAEAQPDAVRMSSEAPRPAPALWVAPLFSLTLTPFAASQGSTLLMVPVGVNLPVSATREWVLELAPLFSHTRCEEAACSAFGLSLSAGMAWTLLPNGKGGGLFLQPKLVGLPSWVGGNQWKAAGAQLSLGLDVGYRLNLGRLFLAFVVGGSAGRGWNVPRNTSSLYTSFLDIPTSYRTNKWVWDVNLNLVRIGANF